MKWLLFALSLAALLTPGRSWRVDDHVERFAVDMEEDARLFDFLMSPRDHSGPSRLGTFKFQNCADPRKEVINVTQLLFSPDPLSFPGTFYVTFAGGIKQTMDSPLKGVVELYRRVGTTWVKIPCIGMVGSCTYDDLCQVLQGAVCPQPFVDKGIPCKCPFTQGNYTLQHAGFEVDGAALPPGDYHAKANLTHGSLLVGCLELWASFD